MLYFCPKASRYSVRAAGGAAALITGLFVLMTPIRDSASLQPPVISSRVSGILLASILMAALAGASLQAILVKRRRAIDESLRPPG